MTDLAVDSAVLRQAADVIDQAAEAFARSAHDPSPLPDGGLGPSPAAREVVMRAADRLTRAGDAAVGLAGLGAAVADRLRMVATGFDMVEAVVGGGR